MAVMIAILFPLAVSQVAYVLIVEDDPVFGELLVMHLEDRGHQSSVARSLSEAREQLARDAPDAVLLDQQLSDGYGTDLLAEMTAGESTPPVIMITGISDNTLAIRAMREGAYDFICKTVGAVATRAAPVLITGESGTGKEVVARAIHHHSGRDGLFLALNCSALAEGLLESELFGHERGSFTGAVARKEGRFELAAGGTLFLDEVGEMPASLQAKLLRVLQEGTFERVGGGRPLRSDARVIAATNRDLERMVRDGGFREDLYYRLNVVRIDMPPLRSRMEDLPALSEHLLHRINVRQHTAVRHIAEGAWSRLKDYPWPGNVRELENVLTRAAILARGDTLTPDLLSLATTPGEGTKSAGATDSGSSAPRLVSLEELEREHVTAVLTHVRWHKGKACEILGISRPALERRIDKYGLE